MEQKSIEAVGAQAPGAAPVPVELAGASAADGALFEVPWTVSNFRKLLTEQDAAVEWCQAAVSAAAVGLDSGSSYGELVDLDAARLALSRAVTVQQRTAEQYRAAVAAAIPQVRSRLDVLNAQRRRELWGEVSKILQAMADCFADARAARDAANERHAADAAAALAALGLDADDPLAVDARLNLPARAGLPHALECIEKAVTETARFYSTNNA